MAGPSWDSHLISDPNIALGHHSDLSSSVPLSQLLACKLALLGRPLLPWTYVVPSNPPQLRCGCRRSPDWAKGCRVCYFVSARTQLDELCKIVEFKQFVENEVNACWELIEAESSSFVRVFAHVARLTRKVSIACSRMGEAWEDRLSLLGLVGVDAKEGCVWFQRVSDVAQLVELTGTEWDQLLVDMKSVVRPGEIRMWEVKLLEFRRIVEYLHVHDPVVLEHLPTTTSPHLPVVDVMSTSDGEVMLARASLEEITFTLGRFTKVANLRESLTQLHKDWLLHDATFVVDFCQSWYEKGSQQVEKGLLAETAELSMFLTEDTIALYKDIRRKVSLIEYTFFLLGRKWKMFKWWNSRVVMAYWTRLSYTVSRAREKVVVGIVYVEQSVLWRELDEAKSVFEQVKIHSNFLHSVQKRLTLLSDSHLLSVSQRVTEMCDIVASGIADDAFEHDVVAELEVEWMEFSKLVSVMEKFILE